MESLTERQQRIVRDIFRAQGVDIEYVTWYRFDGIDGLELDGTYTQSQLLAFAIALQVLGQMKEKYGVE